MDARKSRDRIFVLCGGRDDFGMRKLWTSRERDVFQVSSEQILRNQMLENSPRTVVPGICEDEVRARPERLDSREWQKWAEIPNQLYQTL